jgi:hypothetical protein
VTIQAGKLDADSELLQRNPHGLLIKNSVEYQPHPDEVVGCGEGIARDHESRQCRLLQHLI